MTAKYFAIGDEVVYVGAKPHDDWNRGVVTRASSSVGQTGVRWRDSSQYLSADDFHHVATSDLMLYRKVTQAEIESALAVLRAVGSVDFKPSKPAFKAIKLKGVVPSYEVKVTDKEIEVGCKRITFEGFDQVAEAVAKARAYNGDTLSNAVAAID